MIDLQNPGTFYWFHGVVEDINDPLKLGRFRVRCIGYHTENRQLLPTSDLPWATPILPVTSASMSGIGTSPTGILPGSWVMGFFRDGSSRQDPVVLGTISSKSTKRNSKLGFSDPAGTYPLFNGPDIPSEAISNVSSFSKSSHGDSSLPGNGLVAPQYPHNSTHKTKSGHVIEFDDTPNKERIQITHKSGSLITILADGSVQVYSLGNLNLKSKANITIQAAGNVAITGARIDLN